MTALTLASPVDLYDRAIVRLRLYAREEFPFIFLMFRSVTPADEDDCLSLVRKLVSFVAFRSLIDLTSSCLTRSLACFALLPFALDVGWKCYKINHLLTIQPHAVPEQLLHLAALVALIAIGVFSIYTI